MIYLFRWICIITNSNNCFVHQAINREMAPEYTDEQEEGERQCVWNYQNYSYCLEIL